MSAGKRRGWLVLGGVLGAAIAAVVASAFGILAGVGVAASTVKPVNSSPPTITGTPQEGKTLTANRGTWDNDPTDYDYFWRRCNKNGSSCPIINRANALTYTLTSAAAPHPNPADRLAARSIGSRPYWCRADGDALDMGER